jgi:DNA-binding SARP family transcriptional activator/TolB-like protein/Flp pilus assembly protein TadD
MSPAVARPYLRFLGGAVVEDDRGVAAGILSRRHPLAILALLVAAPTGVLSRGRLGFMLWPDSPEKTARNRLNTYLHQLRSALGHEALASAGDDLRLGADRLSCDLWQFRDALAADDHKRAVALYGGPFLDGFRLGRSPEFEKWVDAEQERLRRGYLDALETLAREAESRGEADVAARWWRERVREDPFDSRATARLMESLAASGNRAAALRAAEEHERLLEAEVGTAPGAEVHALRARLSEPEIAIPDRSTEATSRPPAALDPLAIAVLPFEDLGGSDEAALFASGLHNDLLTRLSAVRDLTVISRTSVLRYRNTELPIPRIARELGVGTILEGGVQQAGDRVRLNVQLIDAASDGHRWAETYDRELTAANLFDIQSELAEKITGSLRATLTPAEERRAMQQMPTENLDAYRLYAHGMEDLDGRTDAGMRQALDFFRQATMHDPDYVLAWVGVADALTLLCEYGYAAAEEMLPEAEQAVQRALALDPQSGEAHASRGLLHEARREGPAAVRELERAVELQPSYASAYNWLSWTNQLLGRAGVARKHSERAVALDPLSLEAVANLAATLWMTGDLEAALHEARRARAMEPDEDTASFYEGMILHHLGRPEEAVEVLQGLSVPWAGSGPLAALALAYGASGATDRAGNIAAELEDAGEVFSAGLVRAGLGERERAFQLFGQVSDWGYWPALAVHHYYPQVWEPLRGDARYQRIVEQVRRSWGL